MERRKNRLQGVLAAASMLILIFDSHLAVEGTRSGIELCIKTVIPSLLPFFVLSMLLTSALEGQVTSFFQPLALLLRIPQSGVPALVPAILGGYPVGAKCVGDLYIHGQIPRQDAERMLAFCSNAGPSFLFGMVAGFFPEKKSIWLLWLIHIISAFLTAISLPAEMPDSRKPSGNSTATQTVISMAVRAMVNVCCWVILFRTLISFLNAWFLWMLPSWVQVLVIGTLELANGCCELSRIPDLSARFVLCACMLSCGGICVLMQTASVTHGLSIRSYLKGKLMQTTFSFLLSCAVVYPRGLAFAALIPFLAIILRKIQKNSGNPQSLPV